MVSSNKRCTTSVLHKPADGQWSRIEVVYSFRSNVLLQLTSRASVLIQIVGEQDDLMNGAK